MTVQIPDDELFFDEIEKRYILLPDLQAVLLAARQAWRRWRANSDQIDAEGLTVEGRWAPVAHPLLGPEARARHAVLAAIKQLDLPDD